MRAPTKRTTINRGHNNTTRCQLAAIVFCLIRSASAWSSANPSGGSSAVSKIRTSQSRLWAVEVLDGDKVSVLWAEELSPDGNAVNDTDAPVPESRDLSQDQEQHLTMRSLWRRRHARSISEGIRRDKTFESILKKAHLESFHANRHYFARTITGIISAVAEEAEGLVVQVNSQKDSPLWEKRIDSIQINFSRLGFRPLRLGGLHNDVTDASISPRQRRKKHTKQDLEMTSVSSMNEAFERIDADRSGTLDRDEIAMALDLVTSSDSDEKLLSVLASELVELYDTNGDGVVDFEEYQFMVNDMAALRKIQLERKQDTENTNDRNPNKSRWPSFGRATSSSTTRDNDASNQRATETPYTNGEESEKESGVQGTGTITLTDLKLDLRQLLFGFFPFIRNITPGGPLVLEPFTATVHGSFNKDDVMESQLVDMGLRRLVARALRRRMGSVRDILDGALFYGRSWNMASGKAPLIEVPRLTEVEFDSEDRLVITGRAMIRTSPDAPVIENAFKVRTKLGTRKNGQVIRLEQPELALVLECPQSWERNAVSMCNKFNWPVPSKPDPLYSFFPIYSPFKVEDNDGFDLGPDNRIKSIYIKDGALRFEMESILRPGRFLGSHYIAFTVPIRTFLITMDRVVNGIQTARRNKRNLKADATITNDGKLSSLSLSSQELLQNSNNHIDNQEGALPILKFADKAINGKDQSKGKSPLVSNVKNKKSFFSRFVEGYLGVGKEAEVRNERLTLAISEWFGRQGNSTAVTASPVTAVEPVNVGGTKDDKPAGR